MTNENDASVVRVSSWTSATGTKPGERYVYAATLENILAHANTHATPLAGRIETDDTR
jgi:hypothetical protein